MKNRSVHLVLAALLLLHALFVWEKFFGSVATGVLAPIAHELGAVRGLVLLTEILFCGVLFVDLVTRFDEIGKDAKRQGLVQFFQVLGVGVGVVGTAMQVFTYFFDSALMS